MGGLVDKGVVVSETFYPTKLTGGKSMQATTAILSIFAASAAITLAITALANG